MLRGSAMMPNPLLSVCDGVLQLPTGPPPARIPLALSGPPARQLDRGSAPRAQTAPVEPDCPASGAVRPTRPPGRALRVSRRRAGPSGWRCEDPGHRPGSADIGRSRPGPPSEVRGARTSSSLRAELIHGGPSVWPGDPRCRLLPAGVRPGRTPPDQRHGVFSPAPMPTTKAAGRSRCTRKRDAGLPSR